MQKDKQCIKEMNVECEDADIQLLYQQLCYIKENKEIYKILFNNDADDGFKENVLEYITGLLWDKADIPISSDGFTSDYLFQYLVSGCIGMIQKWLNNDMTEPPDTVAKLIYDASVSVLGVYGK